MIGALKVLHGLSGVFGGGRNRDVRVVLGPDDFGFGLGAPAPEPSRFIFAVFGLVLIGLGFRLTDLGFLGAITRYFAAETPPS